MPQPHRFSAAMPPPNERIVDVPLTAIKGRVWRWDNAVQTMVSSKDLKGRLVDNALHITSEACPANWLTIDMNAIVAQAGTAADGVPVPASAIAGCVQDMDMPQKRPVSSGDFEGMLDPYALSIGCAECPCFWLRLSVDTIVALMH